MNKVHTGHRDRMRERFLQEGPDGLATHELLEMLLYGTIPRGDTNEIAHRLMDEFGSLSHLIESDPYEMVKIDGVGEKCAVFLSLLHELVRRYEKEKLDKKPALTSVQRSVDYCMALLAYRPSECFYSVYLDSRRRILHTVKVSEGTVNDVPVSSRLVVEKALRCKATGILLCHNHPGGIARPTYDDIQLTHQLASLLEPLGVQIMDHIIIGENKYFSFLENEMLKEE